MASGASRVTVALLVAVATAAALGAIVLRLPSSAPAVRLIAPDDPYVKLDREITADFGMENPVVWVIEARHGTMWTPAMLARIQALTREVFTIPGVIAPDVISLASPNLRDLHVTEDALEPVYLMAQVPETLQAIDNLRHRVDTDANYRGTLVSEDGHAAMVVANFRDDADPRAIANGALALRDRYRDAQAAVYVIGAPVLSAIVPAAAVPVALGAALTLGVGLLVFAILAGRRVFLAATLAAIFASLWAAAAVVALGTVVLPWTAYALPPTILVAVAMVVAGGRAGARWSLGAALTAGFVVLALSVGAPAVAFGIAGAVGSIAATLAAQAARLLTSCDSPPLPSSSGARIAVLALIALALTGVPRLRTSFGAFGYGERYLPARAVTDMRALGRDFPPPSALAIRFRGDSGFVESPEVLQAFDGAAAAVRSDPAVVRVLSLADLVKMVSRAFNDNRDEFLIIPKDRGLVARYLALAYSPGFRRFVDRGFTQSALWVYLSSDRTADLRRVLAALQTQLSAHPVPGAHTDLIGGDGAVVLVAARLAARLMAAAAGFLLAAVAVVGVFGGRRAAAAALAGGLAAAGFAAGAFGWLGVPLDLVSLPCVIVAGIAGTAFGALGGTGKLGVALAVMALLGFGSSLVGANMLGVVLGALLAGPAVATAQRIRTVSG